MSTGQYGSHITWRIRPCVIIAPLPGNHFFSVSRWAVVWIPSSGKWWCESEVERVESYVFWLLYRMMTLLFAPFHSVRLSTMGIGEKRWRSWGELLQGGQERAQQQNPSSLGSVLRKEEKYFACLNYNAGVSGWLCVELYQQLVWRAAFTLFTLVTVDWRLITNQEKPEVGGREGIVCLLFLLDETCK